MKLSGQGRTYEREDAIAQGGFGIVYRARDLEDGSVVAVKMPQRHLSADQLSIFLREAEMAQRVESQYVVRVLAWGNDPQFIALEYVAEPTLASVIADRRRDGKPWSEAELRNLFTQMSKGVRDINTVLLHRDLKPLNIFLVGTLPKISDFGIAKRIDDSTRTITFKNAGTLSYAAPERIRGLSADARSDQYSLGIIFLEMAALAPPFSGNDDEVAHAQFYSLPRRISELGPYSEALASVVARMTEKQPHDRYASWGEVIEALESTSASAEAMDSGASSVALAATIAAHRSAARQRQLDAQRQSEEQERITTDRRGFLSHWVRLISRTLERKVQSVNKALNEDALKWRSPGALNAADSYEFSVNYLDKALQLHFGIFPSKAPDDPKIWGYAHVMTNAGWWSSNYVVLPEPLPYGTLRAVDLSVFALIANRQNLRYDRVGGRYIPVGRDYAIAQDSRAIRAQWDDRDVMSTLQWVETECNLDEHFDLALKTLIENAAAPPPPSRRTGGGHNFVDEY